MVYSFARVSAVIGMNGDDYYPDGKRWWFRLHEKGGKFHEVPAHHKAEEYLDAYLARRRHHVQQVGSVVSDGGSKETAHRSADRSA